MEFYSHGFAYAEDADALDCDRCGSRMRILNSEPMARLKLQN
jgi:hypothetical protein